MKNSCRRALLPLIFLAFGADLRAQFLITEFMANNVSSNDLDEDVKHSDWIEIQNSGSANSTLNGWYLTDDPNSLRKWQFPVTSPAVSLPGASRITVWASGKNRKASVARLHTNFKLSAEPGYLALVRPDGVTVEHSYNYPGQFPNGTYGVSAIVTNNVILSDAPTSAAGFAKVPTSAADFATNFNGWNASPTFDTTGWQAGAGFGFGAPFTGILGSNGNVGAFMLNLNASCFVRYTFTPPTGSISNVRLKIKHDDGYVAYLNGTRFASDRAPASLAWDSAATSDKLDSTAGTNFVVTAENGPGLLTPGTNVLAFQLLNSSAANANALLRPQLEIDTYVISSTGYLSTPTRGLLNSAARSTVGPAINDTTDKPAQPVGGAASLPILITTKVSATLNPLAATTPVTLKWRIQFGAETAVVMVDDATGGDVKANDGIYTASIPTTAMTAGQLIRWRIEVKDSVNNYSYDPPYPGFSATTPPANPPVVDQAIEYEQYFGTMSVPVLTGTTNLPVLHWFLNGTDNTGSNSVPNATYPGTRCSFFWQPLPKDNPPVGYVPPKPRYYDNVLVNLHGQSSSGFPKKSHDLSFSKDNQFLWKDGEPETSGTNLLTNYADKSKVRNPLAWWTWEKSGHIASHYDTTIRVQQNGAFKGLWDIVENANASWLKRENLDGAGALYKVYNQLESAAITTGNNSVEKKNPNDSDSSDLGLFVAGIADSNTMTNRLKFAYDNADIASLINLLATHSILLSRDFGHKNYYIYRDTNGTGEWSLLPWDQDLCMGHTWNATPGYWDDDIHSQGPLQIGVTTNRLINIVYNTPELNRMFVRRLRTLADQFFVSAIATDGPWEQQIATLLNKLDPNPNNPAAGTDDADLDMRAWGFWTDGAGGASISYTNASVLDHTIRAQANRITTANPIPPNPGSAAPYAGWGDNSTSLLPFIPGRRAFFFNATPPASTSATFPSANASLPTAQPLNPALIIEGIDFNPTAGSQDQEYFIIRNPNNYDVDISGWTLSGSIKMTFKGGTVIPAAGTPTTQPNNSAYVNQLIVANKPQGFRLRSVSPKANEYRLVTGPYDHQLSARGGSIILSRPNDPLNPALGFTPVLTQTYSGVPTYQQNFLRVTEINFKPAPATDAELTQLAGLVGGDFEFVEITNTGTTAMNLGGAYFEEGIEFTFPSSYSLAPGARCLVVASQSAFEIRYGLGHPIAGEFTGSLNNGGETLRLLDSVGEEVLEFIYDNAWYPLPADTYRSLVVTTAAPAHSDYSLPSTWALSGPEGGTPNAADTSYSQVYEGWRLSRFTAGELVLPALTTQPEADADGDGLSNFAEYAFATDPKAKNTEPFPISNIVTVGAETFNTISFRRPKNALDVVYTIEISEDLQIASWAPLSSPVETTTDLGNGQEMVTYRDTVSRGTAPRRFLRATAVK